MLFMSAKSNAKHTLKYRLRLLRFAEGSQIIMCTFYDVVGLSLVLLVYSNYNICLFLPSEINQRVKNITLLLLL